MLVVTQEIVDNAQVVVAVRVFRREFDRPFVVADRLVKALLLDHVNHIDVLVAATHVLVKMGVVALEPPGGTTPCPMRM